MSMRIKCTCDRTFFASDHIVGRQLCCPGCGSRWPLPAALRALMQPDDTVHYAPCPRCAAVCTMGGVICEACVYHLHTGRKLRKGWRRWAMPAAVAGGLAVLATLWAGLGGT